MKKFLLNVVCAFIPYRVFRHCIRENCFKDYFKVLFLNLFFDRKNTKKYKYNLSICLIVKNASRYMDEWINYHKLVGVDHFYIYDNESTDDLKVVLKPYIESGLVDYIYYPGVAKQKRAYNHCIKNNRLDTKWLAFIDDDEFIVPMKHKSILEVLDYLKPKTALAISWCFYGSNGYKSYNDKLVIERFTKHMILDNRKIEVKTIINPRKTFLFMVHHGFYISGYAIDENKKVLKKGASHNLYTGNLIRINHYHLKSLEELLLKKKRGDAVFFKYSKASKKYFEQCNKSMNIVEDDVMKKYIPKVKSMIKKVRK